MEAEAVYATMGRVPYIYDWGLKVSRYEQSVRIFIARLLAEAGEGSVRNAFDVGCGTGLYTFAMLEQNPTCVVTACDRERGMLKRMEEKLKQRGLAHRVNLVQADVTRPIAAIQHASFDAIMTGGVLEHVPLEPTVERLSRALRPGGFFLNSPVRDTISGRVIGWFYGFKPYAGVELSEAFARQGFELRDRISIPPYFLASYKEAQIYQKNHQSV